MLELSTCPTCTSLTQELETAQMRIAQLQAQLAEYIKLTELQAADLERYKKAVADSRPHCPERVPREQLQLAMQQVLASVDAAAAQAANDALNSSDTAQAIASTPPAAPAPPPASHPDRGQPNRHGPARGRGRRRFDLLDANMPTETVELHPPEVDDPDLFERIGEEVSEKVAHRRAQYIRLRIIRYKWVRKVRMLAQGSDAESSAAAEPRVLIAPLPGWAWPQVMADPSAIANVIVSKYDDILPLHRQERISQRHGFHLPRSTQCSWLEAAFVYCYRVVMAMFLASKQSAHCIATDATGAPVQAPGQCNWWHVFVFIADHDHIVFRYSRKHTSRAIEQMLDGFKGYLLADAATIFDVLYREHGLLEVSCWQHCRRYFWKALESDKQRALEALAIIAELFAVDRLSRPVPMPERTEFRAQRARPVLELLDAWIAQHKMSVEPRSPLHKAIGYYSNQRTSLLRFLDDGDLRIDNSGSEQPAAKSRAGQRQLALLPESHRARVVHDLPFPDCVLPSAPPQPSALSRADAAARPALARYADARAIPQILDEHALDPEFRAARHHLASMVPGQSLRLAAAARQHRARRGNAARSRSSGLSARR